MQHEYDGIGLRFDPPATRVARLAEAAEIISRLLAGDEVTFRGDHYAIDRQRLFPAPVQQPVPLLIGGNGRRVLQTAARWAGIVGFTGFSQREGGSGVNPTHYTDAGLAEQVGWVRAAAGDRLADLELSTLVQGVTLTGDRRATAEELRPLLPDLGVDDVLSSPFGWIGTPAQIAEQLAERRRRLGISYLTVFEKDLDAAAAVIEVLRS
jgi:probable F420-dependent oxidoreductase